MTDQSWKKLTSQEAHILLEKGTEPPFSGEYCDHFVNGIYQCRQCQMPLYRARDKFHSGCGWPSFDAEIPGAVKRQVDADGVRVEIICANCQGHLGHVFQGEQYTPKDVRHCVNSLSMRFVSINELFEEVVSTGHDIYAGAIFAAGCFWGVEHDFAAQPGVLATQVGYAGGVAVDPTYEQVCTGETGHAEAVRLIYHRGLTTYSQLVEFFFGMHDPTQLNRQGVDVGNQYRSAIFTLDMQQQETAEEIKQKLMSQGVAAVTQIVAAEKFWPAEEYHQRYFDKHPTRKFSCR